MPTEYTISVSDERLHALKQRLALATFPDELEEAGWDLGAPLPDVKRLTAYWKDHFDWKKAEAKLNELPNFRAPINVDGYGSLDIHFLHKRSSSQNAIPLLFCHGWPGSYIEVTKILDELSIESNGVAFHVVAPSLPNFGWSAGVKKRGFGLAKYAETCHNLMLHLGYEKYDWGFYITRIMGLLYPSACLASHINMVRADPPEWASNPALALENQLTTYTEREKQDLERGKWFTEEGHGYNKEQSTKPQTIGYAMADSPVALLAWIYEKLHDWTDDYPWTDDEVLTWISIYWFSTAGPAASARIYYEATHGDPQYLKARPLGHIPHVKLGLCFAPKELGNVPRSWAKVMGPIAFQSEKNKGGHFLAWEQPHEIVSDLRNMFGEGGGCYKIL